MADAGAGIDVVVAERRTDELLHQIVFFVRTAAGHQTTDGVHAVTFLDIAESLGCIGEGFVPADLTPVIVDRFSDHWLGDAVGVGGVAPGKTAFDAGMAFIGLAVFPGHHADDLGALHLGFKATANATVGAGGGDVMTWLTQLDQRFLRQGGRGAGVDTGAAGHAFGLHEGFVLAGRDA